MQTTRGIILETEVVGGERITRVTEVRDGERSDVSVQTGSIDVRELRIEEYGHVMDLPQRARSDRR